MLPWPSRPMSMPGPRPRCANWGTTELTRDPGGVLRSAAAGVCCGLDPLSVAYGNALVHGGVGLGLAFPVVGVEVGDRHGRTFNDRRDVTA